MSRIPTAPSASFALLTLNVADTQAMITAPARYIEQQGHRACGGHSQAGTGFARAGEMQDDKDGALWRWSKFNAATALSS